MAFTRPSWNAHVSSSCRNAESASKIQIQVLPNIPSSVFSPVCLLTCRITEMVGGQGPGRRSIAMWHIKPRGSLRPANLVVASARTARGCSLQREAMRKLRDSIIALGFADHFEHCNHIVGRMCTQVPLQFYCMGAYPCMCAWMCCYSVIKLQFGSAWSNFQMQYKTTLHVQPIYVATAV